MPQKYEFFILFLLTHKMDDASLILTRLKEPYINFFCDVCNNRQTLISHADIIDKLEKEASGTSRSKQCAKEIEDLNVFGLRMSDYAYKTVSLMHSAEVMGQLCSSKYPAAAPAFIADLNELLISTKNTIESIEEEINRLKSKLNQK
jgi:hypothetical protein